MNPPIRLEYGEEGRTFAIDKNGKIRYLKRTWLPMKRIDIDHTYYENTQDTTKRTHR